MTKLEEQVTELLKHKSAVIKVIKELQEKIRALDNRITKLEQSVNQFRPGFIIPVK
ncbi:MAG: hypothetical protein ACTSVY_15185 [Candidatus Helarchaeota archaeon]